MYKVKEPEKITHNEERCPRRPVEDSLSWSKTRSARQDQESQD